MAEKILNTRILLKYDTLEAWNASTGYLRKGEVAIATVPEGGSGQEVGSVATPQVLVKVGDGKHLFRDLPFITAKAGDVYAWAKAEKLGKDAFSAEVQKLFTDIENDITALEGKVGTTNVADQIAAAVNAAIEGLDVIDTEVAGQFVVAVPQADGKVAPARRALAATDIPELAQEKITGLTTKLSNIDTEIAGIKNAETGILAVAKKYTDDEVAALANGAVKDNTDAIAAINDETTGILATAKGYTDTEVDNAKTAAATDAQGKADKALADAKAYVDAEISAITGGETGSLSALEARVKANEDAIGTMPTAGEGEAAPTLVGMIAAAEEAAADAVEAEATRASNAETALDTRLGQVETFFHFASEEEKNAAYDTLKEIQDYIEGDASAAAQLTAKVNQNTAAIGFTEDDFENGAPKKTLVQLIDDAEAAAETAVGNEATRAKAAEEANAAAAAVADGKAVAAQGAVNTLADKVGAVTEGKTVVEMIADAQAAATYNDTEVRGLINTNATNIGNEVTRATNAEKAINDKIGADALTGGHTTLIAAINAANTGVADNAGEIAEIKEDLAEIIGENGILKQANAYTDTEIGKVNNTITTLEGAVVKEVTGDAYITATKTGNTVALAFNPADLVISCGTSAGLDETAQA